MTFPQEVGSREFAQIRPTFSKSCGKVFFTSDACASVTYTQSCITMKQKQQTLQISLNLHSHLHINRIAFYVTQILLYRFFKGSSSAKLYQEVRVQHGSFIIIAQCLGCHTTLNSGLNEHRLHFSLISVSDSLDCGIMQLEIFLEVGI